MFFDIPAAIKSIADAAGKIFDYKKTSVEHQMETEFIQEKNDREKAIDLALNLFDVIIESNGYLTDKQLKEVKRNLAKFHNLIS